MIITFKFTMGKNYCTSTAMKETISIKIERNERWMLNKIRTRIKVDNQEWEMKLRIMLKYYNQT